jgi:hypothetical protein
MQRDVNQRELARIALKCNTGKPPRRLLEQAVLIAAAVTPDSLSEPPSGAANGGGIHFFGAEQLDEAGLAKLRAISPIAAVDIGMPRSWVFHGTKDDQVLRTVNRNVCRDAEGKVGASCELVTIEGGGHGMGSWRAPEMRHWKAEMVV